MSNNIKTITKPCMICGGHTHPLVDDVLELTYDVCDTCDFIYKEPQFHIPHSDEKQRYLQHHNSDDNIGYVTYLTTFIQESIEPLTGVQSILDFGSGPHPILAELLHERRYQVTDYDPYFHNDLSYQEQTYDLIVLTEVLEHINDPLPTLFHLFELLNEGGRVLIMTQFHQGEEQAFLKWWYRRDRTHVGFYNDTTFDAIASICNVDIEDTNHIDRIVYKK